jgi:hypothetical protein
LIVSTEQNQSKVSPTYTSVSPEAGEKLVPIIVIKVPPLYEPVLGEIEVIVNK